VSIKHETLDAFNKFSKKIEKAVNDMALQDIVNVAHRIVEKKNED
jgi:hypothetical protein